MILENTEQLFIQLFEAMENDRRDIFTSKLRELADRVEEGYPLPNPTDTEINQYLYDFYIDCEIKTNISPEDC